MGLNRNQRQSVCPTAVIPVPSQTRLWLRCLQARPGTFACLQFGERSRMLAPPSKRPHGSADTPTEGLTKAGTSSNG